MQTGLTVISHNIKTGPIPVSTTEKDSCPNSCPFKAGSCYAKGGPLNIHWNKISVKERGTNFDSFTGLVKKLNRNQLWRHNQAGDLSGLNNRIDFSNLNKLVQANKGRRGFTYTHKPVLINDFKDDNLTRREKEILIKENQDAVSFANKNGFTINLSANNLAHADSLKALNIGPVVVVVNSEQKGNVTTPAGNKVVMCPATQRDDVTCASCGFCQKEARTAIVGFPSHGASKRKMNEIVK